MADLRWGSATDPGQIRPQNEDHAHAGPHLFVVADGMGGHLAGEVASEMTVQHLDERIESDGTSTLDDLVSAVNDANTAVYDAALENPEQAGMGTTVVAIAVVEDALDGEALGVANVGDSRGYVLRHDRLRQITIDHSFVQELVAEGAITADEARSHPRRNIVTRALGIEPTVRVDSWTMPIIRGDRFLLCSDGLVDEVSDDDITTVLIEHRDDPQAAADALVAVANAAGGRDNITVVVLDVLDGDDPPDPTAEFDVVPTWADDDTGEVTAEAAIISDPPDDELAPRAAAAGASGAAPDGPSPDGATPDDTTPDGEQPKRRRDRVGRISRFVLIFGIASVLILGFAILAAWARDGYFVAFDEDDRVVIYQGREDVVLWFEPTVEAFGRYDRSELDEASIALVEDRFTFASKASAVDWVANRLSPAPTTTTTTTTTTTIPPTTTTPGTSTTVP